MALEMGIGSFGVRSYNAGLTDQVVTHDEYEISFWTPFVSTPRFFATMQTYAGTDSSQLRQSTDTSKEGTTVFVEEETCSDDEVNHAAEIVGWFAIDSATNEVTGENDHIVHAQSNLDRGCEGFYDATSADVQGGATISEVTGANRGAAGEDQVATGTLGNGGINFNNPDGETATWTVTPCRSGHYYIVFGYAVAQGADRPMSVSVNGAVVDGFLSFPATGSWTTYSEVKVPARLDAGSNTIQLSSIGFSGPDLDYMAIAPIGPIGYGEQTTIGEGGTTRTIDYRLTASGLMGQDVSPEDQWLTVHLGHSYTDPVVIVGPPSELGGQEAVARIKGLRYQQAGGMSSGLGQQYAAGTMTDNNLSDNQCDGHCFDLRLQEPSCQDDLHVEEEVPWMVLESGTWFTDGKSCLRLFSFPI